MRSRTVNTRFLPGLLGLAALVAAVPTAVLAQDGVTPSEARVDTRYAVAADDAAPGFLETSEYMIGTVAVGIVFVDSDGAVDADEQDWTEPQKSFTLTQIRSALDSWEEQEPRANLQFITDVKSVSISYEPITRSTKTADQAVWVAEAMQRLGYPEDAGLYRDWREPYVGAVYEYVNALREQNKTDWAFALFMVNDARDPDGKFSDGHFAYARLGGPYMVTTYQNDGWTPARMSKVVAHEMGHIFYATDHYDNKTERSGYYNTQDVDGSPGLMNGDDTFHLSSDTRIQVGWRDSDGDGTLDPVDTVPLVTLESMYGASPTDRTTFTYSGRAQDQPLTNENSQGSGRSVTINRITSVRYRVDGGAWRNATATDGALNSAVESFSFTLTGMSTGRHVIEVTASNSVENAVAEPIRDDILITHLVVDEVSAPTAYANVGSQQPVRLHLVWAHDASPVTTGSVVLDEVSYVVQSDGWVTAFVSSVVAGVRTPLLSSARSGDIQQFAVVSPLPPISWDRIHAAFVRVSDSYVGVGTPVDVYVQAELEHAGDALGPDDMLFIGGQQATWDAESSAFRAVFTEPSVTKRTLNLTGGLSGKTGITAVESGPLVGVIWDRVRVTEAIPSRLRTDVGATESVLVRAMLEQSGVPLGLNDILSINGRQATWDDGAQGFRLEHTEDGVGEVAFTVTQARQTTEDVDTLADAPRLSIIWDEVRVTLARRRERVDAGSTAEVDVRAVYAYDGAELAGRVTLNVPLRREAIGWEEVTAAGVEDQLYGLTGFTSNTVRIGWDALRVTLTPEHPRVEAGQTARILVAARYASDGTPAEVGVTMDGSLMETALGPRTFKVVSVQDESNGLTLFTADAATVIFDRIEGTYRSVTFLPGTVRLEGTVRYLSDGAPVEDALVLLGTERGRLEDGRYAVAQGAWLPWNEMEAAVLASGFQPIVNRVEGMHIGNTAAEGAVLLGLAAGFALWRRMDK